MNSPVDPYILDLERDVLACLSVFQDSKEEHDGYQSPLQSDKSLLSIPSLSAGKRDTFQVTSRLEEFRRLDSVVQSENSGLPSTRLVQRNMPHFQSNNIVAVSRRTKVRLERSDTTPLDMNTASNRYFHQFLPRRWLSTYWSLYFYDWFHYFLRWHTYYAMILWSTLWTIFVLCFALIYYGLNHSVIELPECKLSAGFNFTFSTAFGFSLLTTTTVGYTLPGGTNSFFEHCPAVQISIYVQCIISLLFNAVLLSFLYARISRAENRSRKLLFADKAIIRPIVVHRGDGHKSHRWSFEFRIFDLDATHPVVESHVRVYASFLPDCQQLQVCRLLRPADTLEGWVFTSVPYSIVHEIDNFSPLAPIHTQATAYDTWFNGSHGLDRRASDARTLQTTRWLCPICSHPCADLASLMSHIRYMKIKNEYSNIPIHDSHQSIPDELLDIHSAKLDVITEEMLKKYLERAEIICVVEGIDPITSGTFQALQSYTLDNIVFNGSFKNCIRLNGDKFLVDLDAFHHITPSYQSELYEE